MKNTSKFFEIIKRCIENKILFIKNMNACCLVKSIYLPILLTTSFVYPQQSTQWGIKVQRKNFPPNFGMQKIVNPIQSIEESMYAQPTSIMRDYETYNHKGR